MEYKKTRRKNNMFPMIFITCAVMLLTGCFQVSQKVWLNPDGSGRMRIEAMLPIITLGQETNIEKMTLEMKKQVEEIMNKSKGIDAWSGVSYSLTDSGQISFSATAYFPDISGIDLHNLPVPDISFQPEGEDKKVLLIDPGKKDIKPAPEKREELSEEEITRRIKEERIKFNQAKNMMSAILSDVRIESSFNLPGRVVSSTNLKKEPDGFYSFSITGKRIIDITSSLIQDDSWLRKQVMSGKDAMNNEILLSDEINEKMFGEKGPLKAVVSGPMKPFFDYAAEVAEIRKKSQAGTP